jgi:hypothetical protein
MTELGKDLPSWNAYTDLADKGGISELLEGALPQFKRLDSPELFSIVLLRSPQNVFHVGIAIDGERMLHVNVGKDACVESFSRLQHQLKGFYVPYDQSSRTA